MKKVYKIALVAILIFYIFAFWLSSCVVCDCAEPDGREHFEFVDKGTGKNLVFGPSATLNAKDIKIFSFENQQRIDAQFFDTLFPIHHIDSTIQFRLDIRKFKRFFVEFGNSDLDTIDVTTRISTGRCCAGGHFYTSFRYNGVAVNISNDGRRRIVK